MLCDLAGPGVFTEALLSQLAPSVVVKHANLSQVLDSNWEAWRQTGICVVTRPQLDERLRNLFSSTQSSFWETGTWGSWVRDRAQLQMRKLPHAWQ